ncbi:glycogen synthase [Robiginitalea sp. IMCC44478]|uniref:glycogen synthase n=1 Tax=Robiginitalea sp. IMCC44478 TaxID=3459122 RepID=UPI004042DAF6
MKRFLFVSAENDAIPACKAGGMGDVVRDVPREIAARGDQVDVVVPAYGRLHKSGTLLSELEVPLRGTSYKVEVYEVPPKKVVPGIRHFVIHHPEIQGGDIAHIYHNDPEEPFYTDAIKYTIFCTAVAECLRADIFKGIQIVHLHDWHSSMLLVLRKFHQQYQALRKLRFVYSIHNLAIQGIRPFADNYSSLKTWFPQMDYSPDALLDIRYPDCINLMAVGIRFADAVHTVSPSYMEDIMQPSRPPEFIGGEGLESDLQTAFEEGRLFGILNGSNYQNIRTAEKGSLYANTIRAIFGWLQEESKKYKADFLAHTGEKVIELLLRPPKFICSSVARLTEQKFYFFKNSPEVFKAMLDRLKEVDGIFMLLGTGDPNYEALFREISYEYPNFIFTNGQSEDLIDSMYLETDLYLMPSLFEPCGISQMLSMRNGNPCLAHATGGLKDTIEHMRTGFLFGGDTYAEKLQNLQEVLNQALDLYFNEPETWQQIRENAARMRFTWKKSVDEYYEKLYTE